MALGALSLPAIEPSFNSDNTAMVPVTVGNTDQKLGTIEIKSPMDQVTEFFAGIDKSLINLVQFAKKSLNLEEKDAQRESLARTDTDDVPGEERKSMLDTIREAYDNVTFGEKLTALLVLGSLLLFRKLKPVLEKILVPVIEVLQKFVKLVGPEGAFYTAIGSILAIKFLPLGKIAKSAGKAIKNAVPSMFQLGKAAGVLKKAFLAMNVFVSKDLPKLLLKAYRGTDNFLVKAFNLLGKAFRTLRIFTLGAMIPAITGMLASLAPMVVAAAPFIAIAAAIAAVLYSMKSGFDAFRQSLEDGDSMLTAIGKGLLDFNATLITLPITLLKGILSYFAGLFGMDNFKEKLDSFSFKDMFINIITGFIDKVKGFFDAIFDFDIKGIIDKIGNIGSQIANTLKAIAKGAVAMVAAAVPGGESPTEAFSRVYNEVLNTGEGVVKNEAAEVANTPLVEDGAMAAAKAAMTTNEAYTTNNTTFNNTTNMMKEKIIELLKFQMQKLEIEREGNTTAPLFVNNNKGGDTNVNNNTTNVSGEPSQDHSETTQKLLTYAI